MKHPIVRVPVFFLFIFPIAVIAQTPRYARVISQSANLRDTPSITSTTAQEIAEDTLVKVLDEKLPWYVVRIGNRVGWMHGDTLEFISIGTATPTQQSVTGGASQREVFPVERTPVPRSSSHGGYIRGPRGGCYYISGSGRKVYVDRSMCN